MGRKLNSGLSLGVSGQLGLENYELLNVLKIQEATHMNQVLSSKSEDVSDDDFKMLDEANVKYKKEDVIFVLHDSSGQLMWLEKGNEKSGLTHILKRHEIDFANKHGVTQDEIPKHINTIIRDGKLEYYKVIQRNGRNCYERLYSKSNQYYLQTGVGENGYIVTAYPISEKEALTLIRRNKK